MPRTTLRSMHDGRLAYHRAAPDAAYWDAHWRATLTAEHYAEALEGKLGRFEDLFTRWLPKTGRILEAGCGTGFYVAALRARGYDAEGVEWGAETVAGVNRLMPDLPVRCGDITLLDVPGGAFAGYISLGVMEHRAEGPEPFLDEAYRLLAPGGVALISVPHLHPLRRFKARLGRYADDPSGLPFYQYAYPANVFATALDRAGFELREAVPYDGFKGLKDELPGSRALLKLLKKTLWTKRRLETCRFGHMMMFACVKPGPSDTPKVTT